MSLGGWAVFAAFWVVFVTSPGPNAVNCIRNGMTLGLRGALIGVSAILAQALLFLFLSAAGITALIAASPVAFETARFAGAAILIALGVRTWRAAGRELATETRSDGSVWLTAFLIATVNPKSVAGYLAAFSQFVEPDVPIMAQMGAIVPTALVITGLSYTGYSALGAWLGQKALSAVADTAVRRGLAACFLLYGVALAATAIGGQA